jgi:hypothetical protein
MALVIDAPAIPTWKSHTNTASLYRKPVFFSIHAFWDSAEAHAEAHADAAPTHDTMLRHKKRPEARASGRLSIFLGSGQ